MAVMAVHSRTGILPSSSAVGSVLDSNSTSQGLDWNVCRTLAKVQYRVHTDAVKAHLIPPELDTRQAGMVYASEADVLNKALFWMTAAEWNNAN